MTKTTMTKKTMMKMGKKTMMTLTKKTMMTMGMMIMKLNSSPKIMTKVKESLNTSAMHWISEPAKVKLAASLEKRNRSSKFCLKRSPLELNQAAMNPEPWGVSVTCLEARTRVAVMNPEDWRISVTCLEVRRRSFPEVLRISAMSPKERTQQEELRPPARLPDRMARDLKGKALTKF